MSPGFTSITEVRERISENPEILNPTWYADSKILEWQFSNTGDFGKAEGDHEGEILKSFFLVIHRQNLTVGESLISFGPPNYVNLIWAGPRHCYVTLIYLSLGMSLISTLECKEPGIFSSEHYFQVMISEDTPIDSMYLFRTGEDGYFKTFGPESVSDLLIEWKGLGEYKKNH